MTRTLDEPTNTNLGTLVGTWRRFGETGPVYEILAVDNSEHDHNGVARVRVLETGEEFDYRLPELLEDQKES